jgi:uncharacterized protein YdeI (YjbR/CyaY-like superfamily)
MEQKNTPNFHASSQKEWRKWLIKNHKKEDYIWLIIYKKESGVPSVHYSEAVDEALCFGWIDSKPNKRDDKSYYQYFAKRNPKSNWSKINKDKVARLTEAGLMTEAGIYMVALAKETGTWQALENVDNLELPDEMMALMKKNKTAFTHWQAFPKSTRRGILEWILNAKKIETRLKRIQETIELAAQNIRANQFTRK